jgi:hypothetical protein
MAKRGRPTIGAEPMTPAERQRRRRAKLVRTGPGRTGRPKYDFFGDPNRYALAHCELMIRQGKSERKALVIAAAATWRRGPDFVGPLLPRPALRDGAALLYVPPGVLPPRARKGRAKGQVEVLRWKLQSARRNPAAREWLRVVANCFEMVGQTQDESIRRALMLKVISLTGRDFEDLLKRHASDFRDGLNLV